MVEYKGINHGILENILELILTCDIENKNDLWIVYIHNQMAGK